MDRVGVGMRAVRWRLEKISLLWKKGVLVSEMVRKEDRARKRQEWVGRWVRERWE